MKKALVILLVASVVSCSKDGGDCVWIASPGDYYYDHAPTADEINQLETGCSCTVTITKECH